MHNTFGSQVREGGKIRKGNELLTTEARIKVSRMQREGTLPPQLGGRGRQIDRNIT